MKLIEPDVPASKPEPYVHFGPGRGAVLSNEFQYLRTLAANRAAENLVSVSPAACAHTDLSAQEGEIMSAGYTNLEFVTTSEVQSGDC